MRRQPRVRMFGIERFRPILPDECVHEPFILELLPKQAFVPWSHFPDYTKRRAYSGGSRAGMQGKREKMLAGGAWGGKPPASVVCTTGWVNSLLRRLLRRSRRRRRRPLFRLIFAGWQRRPGSAPSAE